MRQALGLAFFAVWVVGFSGWFLSAVLRVTDCFFLCFGDTRLLLVADRWFGTYAFFVAAVLWNTSFMPHAPATFYPDWAFAIAYIVLLALTILLREWAIRRTPSQA